MQRGAATPGIGQHRAVGSRRRPSHQAGLLETPINVPMVSGPA
jgi:hypothetical protein